MTINPIKRLFRPCRPTSTKFQKSYTQTRPYLDPIQNSFAKQLKTKSPSVAVLNGARFWVGRNSLIYIEGGSVRAINSKPSGYENHKKNTLKIAKSTDDLYTLF